MATDIEKIIGEMDYQETREMFAECLVNLDIADVISVLSNTLAQADIDEIVESI